MTEMKLIICLLTKIFNAQLGFESRAIQDGVLTMLSLYTKQLVGNLSTTSPVIDDLITCIISPLIIPYGEITKKYWLCVKISKLFKLLVNHHNIIIYIGALL